MQLLQARQQLQAQDALALAGASLESLNGLSAALTAGAVAAAGGTDPLEALAFYQQGRAGVQGFMHPLLQQHYAAAAAAAAAAAGAAAGRGNGAYAALGLEGDDDMEGALSCF